jgi:hypothetical protein
MRSKRLSDMEPGEEAGLHSVESGAATHSVPADTIRYPDQPQACGFFL